jgi:beta-galactosidase/beta-glucuronidase
VTIVGFQTAIIRDVVTTQQHGDQMTEAERAALSLQTGDVRLNVTSYLRIAPRPTPLANSGVVTACVAGVCANSSAVLLTASSDQSGDALLPVSVVLVIRSPALWWPQTLGDATLYNLTLVLSTTLVEHTLTRRIGFRSLSILRTKDAAPGLTMQFVVNGAPLYLKGANVVPLDSFHARVTPSNLTRVIDSATDSHMNILRSHHTPLSAAECHCISSSSHLPLTPRLCVCLCA